jgi:DNA polymerase beta
MSNHDWKQTIIDSLEVLRKRDLADKERFKAQAYAKVIAQLRDHNQPITRYEDVKNIKGIGEQIGKKIKEILETGQLASAVKAMELYPIAALDALQNIYGVGPAKAKELVSAGITSIPQLREEVKKNPKLLNDKQKIGLQYYEDLLERIPRKEMEEHEGVLTRQRPPGYTMDIVGSFRRQAQTSGDIDVLIRMPKKAAQQEAAAVLATYVQTLQESNYIEQILALGEHKCMAISRLEGGKARRLDLLMTPDNEYAYALLYFTGSDKFNVAFRQHALQMGYTLNEHTLTPIRPDVRPVPYMPTEKSIFQFLRLRYVEPQDRIDGNQIKPMRFVVPKE